MVEKHEFQDHLGFGQDSEITTTLDKQRNGNPFKLFGITPIIENREDNIHMQGDKVQSVRDEAGATFAAHEYLSQQPQKEM